MKFGILYNTDYHRDLHGSAAQYYEMLLGQTELAEQLGYCSVWFGEHHYWGYSFGSPSTIAMAAAARTKRIRLGFGVSLVPLNHPVRLAEEYAMFDVLTGGRLEYGIGRGFLRYTYEVLGVDTNESHARYHEGTEIIEQLWTSAGKPVNYEGKFWRLRDYQFFPQPLQQPYPPIYASGVIEPASCAWVGSCGYHLGTAFFIPRREQIRDNIELYRSKLSEHGFDPKTRDVCGVFQMYCGESEAEARVVGEQHVMRYFQFSGRIDKRGGLHTSRDYQAYGGSLARVFAGKSYDDMFNENLILVGEPHALIDKISWARDYYGTNYLLLEVAQGGAPDGKVRASLERFASKVMPAFAQDGR